MTAQCQAEAQAEADAETATIAMQFCLPQSQIPATGRYSLLCGYLTGRGEEGAGRIEPIRSDDLKAV